MSNYTKSTNFATKDNLSPGDPLKIVRGTEIDTEFNNISTAISTKTDNSAAAITGGSITGITDLAIADGGTGASTATAALNNLLPSQTSNANKYLQTDGTNATWDAVSLSTSDITGTLPVANGGTGVTSSTGTGNVVLSNSPTLVTPALGTPASGVATNLTGLPLTTGVTGTLPVANGGTGVTTSTGTGNVVLSTSPTLVTPALGTPSALVGTNITGTASGLTAGNVTTNANLTGAVTSVGNATSLGSFTSAQLAGALTDETGTGSAVFATSPTLVTPILGTPTSATLTNATGLPISTGVSGLGTGVATFLATPSSANLRSALTDETGTGSAVFATSPTLVTPVLGTPTSATLTNATGLPLTTGVTGTLPTANGGTNLTSFTSGGVVYASSTSALATGSALTFDGTNFGVGTTPVANSPIAVQANTGNTAIRLIGTSNGSTSNAGIFWYDSNNTTFNGYIGNFSTGFDFYNQRNTPIVFYTNAAEKMRITGAGDVGIGTSSPGSKLDVVRSATTTTAFDESVIRAINTGAATLNQRVDIAMRWQDGTYNGIGGISMLRESATARSGALVFSPIGSDGNPLAAMRLDSAGNLGLGTAPSAWRSGTPAFQIGSAGFCAFADSGITAELGNNVFLNSSSQYIYLRTDAASRYRQYQGVHSWLTAGSGTEGTAVGFSTVMTLDTSGNLLVGTTSGVVGGERLSVDSGSQRGAVLKNSSSGNELLGCWNSATTGDNGFAIFWTEASPTQRGSISYNRTGGLTVYATTSDYRAKDIIGPVTNSGALIDSIPVYMGKMKWAEQERPMFIAHETPAYAHTGEKDAVDADGNPVYQQMDASALIPVMWAEIQSLRQRLSAANL